MELMIGKYTIEGTGIQTLYMSAENFLEKALPMIIEERFGSLKTIYGSNSRLGAPASPDYQP